MVKKDAYWFTHDSNARHDPKIIAMRADYGYKGYGWYWVIIETLRESNEYELDVSNKFVTSALCVELGINSNELKQFIEDCIFQYNLLDYTDNSLKRITSKSLKSRMYIWDEKKQRRREAGKKGAQSKWMPEQTEMPDNGNAQINDGIAHKSDGNAQINDGNAPKKNGINIINRINNIDNINIDTPEGISEYIYQLFVRIWQENPKQILVDQFSRLFLLFDRDKELIEYAFREAVLSDVTNYRYVRRIMENRRAELSSKKEIETAQRKTIIVKDMTREKEAWKNIKLVEDSFNINKKPEDK